MPITLCGENPNFCAFVEMIPYLDFVIAFLMVLAFVFFLKVRSYY